MQSRGHFTLLKATESSWYVLYILHNSLLIVMKGANNSGGLCIYIEFVMMFKLGSC